MVELLDHEGLLPAITFIFSRVGCDAAVKQCLRSSLRLTTDDERARIAEVVDRRCADLSDSDLVVLGYHEWREGLLRGLAAHHAGMLPVFRHTVEELFTEGLVKAVFATETLALGINMPARTVVLERLVKFDGEQHAQLTPGEYTQLTGRAGRRGIDVEGHAVVLWTPDVDPAEVAGLASTRTFPLRSSFAPSYNMTINLVNQMGPTQAHKLLERSFAQYQADRSVVGLVRASNVASRCSTRSPPTSADATPRSSSMRGCAPRSRNGRRPSRVRRGCSAGRAANDALSSLRRGDIVNIADGRRAGLAVVLEPARDSDDPRPLVLTENRWAGRISSADYSGASAKLGSMTLPKRVEHRQPRVRRDVASALRSATAGMEVPPRAGEAARRATMTSTRNWPACASSLQRHPAHRLSDREEKVRLAERYLRIERDNDQIQQKVAAATNSLARTFDRIVVLLTERGFIRDTDGDLGVTDDGRLLARIYSESDLLVAECLRGRRVGGVVARGAGRRVVGGAVRVAGRLARDTAGRRHPHRQAASRAGRHPPVVRRPARRRAAAPDLAEPRARRGLRRRRLPLGHHRRPGFGARRIRHRPHGLAAFGGRLRPLVPPGPRSGRPGAQCRADAGAPHRRETRHRRRSTRRRRC